MPFTLNDFDCFTPSWLFHPLPHFSFTYAAVDALRKRLQGGIGKKTKER